MSVEALFREFVESFGRLFDHRPLLQGEVSFCLREFEEKRANREQVRLQKCLEYGKENYETLIPQIMEPLQTNFPKFQKSVSEAVDLSQNILMLENISAKDEWLKKRRLQRTQSWNEFLVNSETRTKAANEEFAREAKMMEKHYMDLEEKLKIADHKTKPINNAENDFGLSDKEEVINLDKVDVHPTATEEAGSLDVRHRDKAQFDNLNNEDVANSENL